jgi:phosphate transport system substrate-binding protein
MKGVAVSKRRLRGALVGGAAALTLTVPAASAEAKTITESGSTSVAPLATKLARKYVKRTNHRVGFRILQGGSDVGISDVAHGRVTIGNSSRDPKSGDPGGLVFNKIAKDAICVITHSNNPVQNLTEAQVRALFGGSARHWNDLNIGSTRGGNTVDVFVRTPASGTQDAFQNLFMGGKPSSGGTPIFSGASQKASNGLIKQAVASDKDGLGYVSEHFARRGVHRVAFKGVPCTLRNAKSGSYPGVRSFYHVTRGAPHGAARKYIKWVRRSRAARRIIRTEWVPLR